MVPTAYACDCACIWPDHETHTVHHINPNGQGNLLWSRCTVISVSRKQDMAYSSFHCLQQHYSLWIRMSQNSTNYICVAFYRCGRVILPWNDIEITAREHHRASIQRLLFATLNTIFKGAHIECEITWDGSKDDNAAVISTVFFPLLFIKVWQRHMKPKLWNCVCFCVFSSFSITRFKFSTNSMSAS